MKNKKVKKDKTAKDIVKIVLKGMKTNVNDPIALEQDFSYVTYVLVSLMRDMNGTKATKKFINNVLKMGA